MAGDPNWANVSLLCHCDGTNGSTAFTDRSPSPLTLTAAGGAQVSTANPKFGTGAAVFSVNASLQTNGGPAFQFGAGQFTVEAFAYFTSAPGAGFSIIMGDYVGASNLGWDFGIITGALAFYYSVTGADNFNVGAAYVPTLNTWIHLAVDRDASNVLRVYRDGVVHASATVSAILNASINPWFIGNDRNVSRGMLGQLDEVRVTKGVARYGGAFTPPTSPFPEGVFVADQGARVMVMA